MRKAIEKSPFFIVGCPRSGTTLLQLLISSHPNIAIPPESHLFDRFANIFSQYGDLNKELNLKTFVKDILKDHHIRDWGLEISENEFIASLKEISIRAVLSNVFDHYIKKEGKNRWGDKTPQHMFYLHIVNSIFPEAKFINIVRDGRDVAVSSSNIFVGPPSIYGIAKEWKAYINSFNKFKDSIEKNRYIEIKYEDMVRNPEKEINRILEFLNESPIKIKKELPFSKVKNYYLNTDAHMLSISKPINDKKVEIFRKKLSFKQIQLFESLTKDSLKLYNYNLTTNAAYTINIIEKIYFFYMDKFYRYYRKYCRPREISKAWFLFKREIQLHFRNLFRIYFFKAK